MHSVVHAAVPATDGGGAEPRWRPTLRFVIAVGFAAGVCEVVWRSIPGGLSARTSTVGYSTVNNFDINRYTDAYILVGFVLPVLALAAYGLLSWRGPLRRTPLPEAGLFPLLAVDASGPEVAHHRPLLVELCWSLGRLFIPALTVTLIVSIGGNPEQQGISGLDDLAGVLYAVAVVIAGSAVWRLSSPPVRHPPASRARQVLHAVSRANSLAALVVVPLLYVASSGTELTVRSNHHTVHYPWLPVWLVVVLTVGALLIRRRWVRAATPPDVEGNVLAWIVGPVLLYVCVAAIPGALGVFQAFDDAQTLSTPQLMFVHGLLPWKDLYLIHGLLNDAFSGGIGILVFGNSRWGGTAGMSIYVYPAFWLSTYFMVAYFSRRNRLVLLGFGALVLSGYFGVNSPQFLVVPICLTLFAMVLGSDSWPRCAAFGFAVVASMALVPEAAIFEIGLLPIVALYELAAHRRGAGPLILCRTWRSLTAAIITGVVLLIYLATTGSVSDFIHFYLDFASDHAISNGLPVQWKLGTDLLDSFSFFAPMALWLLTLWRVAAKLVRRSEWSARDWTMVAAATAAILYYPKAVQRADVGHALEAFTVCVPILVLWGMELIAVLDRGVRRLARYITHSAQAAAGSFQGLGRPATVTAVAVILVLAPIPWSRLRATPAYFHTSSPVPAPSTPHLGYTVPGAVDTKLIAALGEIIDRYAGPTAPVMDFTNQLGIVYYILNRVPSTRYYHIEEAVTLSQQDTAVSEIAKSDPPLVVYSSLTFGLPVFDGIPMMVREYAVSAYLLDHYRPIVDVGGEVVLLRNDLMAHRPPLPRLGFPTLTTDLYDSSFSCAFGDIFNFFPTPADLSTERHVTAQILFSDVRGTYHLVLPRGTDLLDYSWVQLNANRSLGKSKFTISDTPDAAVNHEISFNSLPSAGKHLDVLVDGCMQWHGYDTNSLYFSSSTPPGTHIAVTLIR